MRLKRRNLFEHFEVQGAEYIDSDIRYDLFLIKTWDAAEQFTANNNTAGKVFTTDINTFNRYIVNNTQNKLFFFVESDTNHVVSAVLKDGSNHNFSYSEDINFKVNFEYENEQGIGVYNENLKLPFYLIPGLTYGEYNNNLGLIIQNNCLLQLNQYFANPSNRSIQELVIPDTVLKIQSNAFNEKTSDEYNINFIIIPDSVETVEKNAVRQSFIENHSELEGICSEISDVDIPEGWAEDAIEGYNINDIISWNYGLNPEQLEIRRQEMQTRLEREAEEEQERLRQEEEERRNREEQERLRQEEQERLKREAQDRVLNNLIYKELPNEIHIIRAKKDAPKILIIPGKINNKPVTKIAPFAFYNNKYLTNIILPDTIKEIGKAAFYGTCSVYIPVKIFNRIKQNTDSFTSDAFYSGNKKLYSNIEELRNKLGNDEVLYI